jgi:glyoxylase-like metal-dependent hydrolase (beta-lactamase superfamily II)
VRLHALVGLLRHPAHGWLLFDTGYAPRLVAATQPWPFRLYRAITPFQAPPELAVARQLQRLGLAPADIGGVIVSHFHADHIAGLIDFPNARFICSRAALAAAAGLRGLGALRRGFVPGLLPADFAERARPVKAFDGPPVAGLGATHDVWGDGTLRLVALPGHARGQVGALAETTRGPVLLAADGAWYRQSIRERRPPSPVVRLFVDDLRALRATLDGLHAFALACPQAAIIPTHCPEAYAEFCAGLAPEG